MGSGGSRKSKHGEVMLDIMDLVASLCNSQTATQKKDIYSQESTISKNFLLVDVRCYTCGQWGHSIDQCPIWILGTLNHKSEQISNNIKANISKYQRYVEFCDTNWNKSPNYNNVDNSQRETYKLFCQNKSIEEIAVIRKLQVLSIEDHIISCMMSRLPVDPQQIGLTEEIYEEIIGIYNTVGKNAKLGMIKEMCNANITYIQIRCTRVICNF